MRKQAKTYEEWLAMDKESRNAYYDSLNPNEDHPVFTGLEADFISWARDVAPEAEAIMGNNHGCRELRLTYPQGTKKVLPEIKYFKGMWVRVVVDEPVDPALLPSQKEMICGLLVIILRAPFVLISELIRKIARKLK